MANEIATRSGDSVFVPKTLELKGTFYSQIIPAALDVIKLFSLSVDARYGH
jgi:hypothetical protein